MGLTAPPRRPRPDNRPDAGRGQDAETGGRWAALGAELDRWAAYGRSATFWWRDDDAIDATPALDRLLELGSAYDTPLSLAVIPASSREGLFNRLHGNDSVTVLQHGYAHTNHAPAGMKKAELGVHRQPDAVLSELAQGLAMLRRSGGRQALPVLVPPWNRIDDAIVAGMAGIGLRGVSTAKPRRQACDRHGLAHANVHVDPVDWPAQRRGEHGFLGDAASLDAAIGHLRARRRGEVDADEPTGLLTHHLVMDEPTWDFVERFLAATTAHAAARWLDARAVFPVAIETRR